MKILYIAYSCDPYSGSEDKIGWNIPFESAKKNQVYVITKKEHEEHINNFLKNNQVYNLKIYYVDIPPIYKKIFKGFFYSGRLNIWHRKVLSLAARLCREQGIRIIHQITPIEFRSIGSYGSIPNTKFVCGPLGGGEKIPLSLITYVKRHRIIEVIRKYMNQYSRFCLRMNGRLKNSDYVLFANRETRNYLADKIKLPQYQKITTEIALSDEDIIIDQLGKKQHHQLHILVVGRLIYRKGHQFLLDVLEEIPEQYQYQCRIVGEGPEFGRLKARCLHSKRLKDCVIVTGSVPYEQMKKTYSWADVLIVPSLRETTGSVILEAMGQGIPVITIDRFGGRKLVNNSVGWLYDGTSKETIVTSLRNIIIECIQSPQSVRTKALNASYRAQEYTWDKKSKEYQEIYNAIIGS